MKIRTDFVTNSSSSSFVTVNVHLKNGECYSMHWDSGNIDLEYVAPLELDESDYQNLQTGKELLQICYNYADDICAEWKKIFSSEERGFFVGDVKKIEELHNISASVKKIEIETGYEIEDPIYDVIDSYNYSTKKHRYKEYEQDYDHYGVLSYNSYGSDKKVNHQSIESFIAQISNDNSFNNSYLRRTKYEELKEAVSKEKEWLQRFKKQLSTGKLVVKGNVFAFTGVEELSVWPTILEKLNASGGIYKSAASGKINYLVCNPARAGESKIKKVFELNSKGKNIKLILLKDFLKTIKVTVKTPQEELAEYEENKQKLK